MAYGRNVANYSGRDSWGYLAISTLSLAFNLALARQGWPVVGQLGTISPNGGGIIREREYLYE